MAIKTRAKAKCKKTTVTKPARRRKMVRKTRMIRKKAAKKAPPRQAAPVTEVGPNDDFGLKVVEHAREHDIVYKVRS